MKILILSNLTSYTYNFRFEIIQKMISTGHSVSYACHNDDQKKNDNLISLGCKFYEVPFNGKGTNIKEEINLINAYKKLVSVENPDIVFTFTIKMNLYGGLISIFHKIPFIPMITGLGELEKKGKLHFILLTLHKFVMPKAKCIVFQNEDNKEFFRQNKIKIKDSIIVPGSGINLENFPLEEYPDTTSIAFSFIGRLTTAKGIENYLDAAQRLSSDTISFYAAGPIDEVYKDRVERLCNECKLKYEGLLSDVRPLLKKTSCLVLPTFHPEGLSNVILEASATGRPIICTERTGCKEIVENNKNGLFCKARDSENLISVISTFCKLDKNKRVSMGLEGRKIVESKFDRKLVVDTYMRLLEK